GPQGQLAAVHVTGGPPPRVRPGQRPEHRVGGQVAGDRLRVRVQVEQAPAALHRGGQVAQVLELELALDVARIRARSGPVFARGGHEGAEGQDAHPVWQVDGA